MGEEFLFLLLLLKKKGCESKKQKGWGIFFLTFHVLDPEHRRSVNPKCGVDSDGQHHTRRCREDERDVGHFGHDDRQRDGERVVDDRRADDRMAPENTENTEWVRTRLRTSRGRV